MNAQIGHLTLEQARAELKRDPSPVSPIGDTEYQQRIERARTLLRQQGLQALLVTAGTSLRYVSGIPWGASERLVAMLIPLHGEPSVFCPAFEEGSLQHALRVPAHLRLWEEHEDPQSLVAHTAHESHADAIALDPAAPVAVLTRLQAAAPHARIVDATAIIDGCRMCKSAAELALMQRATDITLKVHRLVAGIVHEGIAASELKAFIDHAHRALGADGGSTFCIVQFGHATAFPHGIPGDQQLRANDLILVDTGCTVGGYHSDITRCYSFGRTDPEHERIWELEHAAQQAAFAAVHPGITCEAVDRAARKVIEDAGLGPGYQLPGLPHRTGHGCGLDLHETPYVVPGDKTPLAPGMCCSDEPMIVIPDRFGIRLEDHFHVTDDAAAWFTPPSPAIDQPFV